MACFHGTGRTDTGPLGVCLSVSCPPTRLRLLGQGSDVRLVTRTVLGGSCLLLSACSGSAATATPSGAQGSPSASAAPNVAIACSSVHTTTPIDKVPATCAALWRPYLVTMVPPPDVLRQENVPAAPKVTNMTDGAVSQTDAQHWADASNWDSGWLRWADAQDQRFLLPKLVGSALVGPSQEQALEQGATISDPDCIYPESNTLFPVTASDRAYFAHKNLPTDDKYVLVATFTGPCVSVATYPDGHQQPLPGTSGPVTAFAPGVLRHDPVLGDIWYTDAGGGCDDPVGPPQEWCQR